MVLSMGSLSISVLRDESLAVSVDMKHFRGTLITTSPRFVSSVIFRPKPARMKLLHIYPIARVAAKKCKQYLWLHFHGTLLKWNILFRVQALKTFLIAIGCFIISTSEKVVSGAITLNKKDHSKVCL